MEAGDQASERGKPAGLRWTETRQGETRRFELQPRRWAATRLLLALSAWLLLLGLTVLAFSRGRMGFLFLPLVFPIGRFKGSLDLLLRGSALSMDRLSLRARRIPLGEEESVADLAEIDRFLAAPWDDHPWLGGRDWWTVVAVAKTGGRLEIKIFVPCRERARFVAERLTEAMEELRTPSGYRD